MENIDQFNRCYPLSDSFCGAHKYCCNNTSLFPALVHNFKCVTCFLRKDTPSGVIPFLPADESANEHFANNHVLLCLICQSQIFSGPLSKLKAFLHITDCIDKTTYNSSRPYICIVSKPCG